MLIYQYNTTSYILREPEDVNIDVDRFIKEMESVMNYHASIETSSDADNEDEASSDLDFGK